MDHIMSVCVQDHNPDSSDGSWYCLTVSEKINHTYMFDERQEDQQSVDCDPQCCSTFICKQTLISAD